MTMRLLGRRRFRRTLPKAVAIIGSVALLSTIAVSSVNRPAVAKPPSPLKDLVTTDAFPTPQLDWKDCQSGWGATIKCATVNVPLNWQQPRGKTLSLSLVKVPATNPGKRVGTVFYNPGGPGAPAAQILRGFPDIIPAPVLERFDAVAFDPRFVGDSSPALCVNDEEIKKVMALPPFPVTKAEEQHYLKTMAAYTKSCAAKAPQLQYASTGSVVRDLDLMRKAVGDQQLTYIGHSYGTYIGQTYAQLFPTKVRALFLDGVLDAKAWATGYRNEWKRLPFSSRVQSDLGSSRALNAFLRQCGQVGPSRCGLAAHGNPRAAFNTIVAGLKAKPLTLPNGSVLDYANFTVNTFLQLQSARGLYKFGNELAQWYVLVKAASQSSNPATVVASVTAKSPAAKAAVARLQDQLKAQQVQAIPASYAEPQPGPSPEQLAGAKNGAEIMAAVGCSDTLNPRRGAAWPVAAKVRDQRYPHFGRFWAWQSVACATWPLQDPNAYRGPFGGQTANPLVLANSTLDPSTPPEGAIVTAKRYAGSRLLLLKGYGHVTNRLPSACVQQAKNAYLIEGKLPPRGIVCTQDVDPFQPK